MANFLTPFPLYAPAHILDDLCSIPQLRRYLMDVDGWPISQPKNE